MKNIKLLYQFSMVILILITSQKMHAVDVWPGGSGTAYNFHNLELQIGHSIEPSGSAWHAGQNRLYIASDEGDLLELDINGNLTNHWYLAPDLINLVNSSDLEGVTIINNDMPMIYLGVEGANSIVEFDIDSGTLTGKSWDLKSWMGSSTSIGLEALAFVPNGQHSYTPSNFGGLFYVGRQSNGSEAIIYIFNINLSQSNSTSLVHQFTPKSGIADISALDYDSQNQKLCAVFDNNNLLVVMDSSGSILQEYSLPGYAEEAFVLIPNCPQENATIFIGDDATPKIWKYTEFPMTCLPLDSPPVEDPPPSEDIPPPEDSASKYLYENNFDNNLTWNANLVLTESASWTLSNNKLTVSSTEALEAWIELHKDLSNQSQFLISFDMTVQDALTVSLDIFGSIITLYSVLEKNNQTKLLIKNQTHILCLVNRTNDYHVTIWMDGKLYLENQLLSNIAHPYIRWGSHLLNGSMEYDNFVISAAPNTNIYPLYISFRDGWQFFYKSGDSKIKWEFSNSNEYLKTYGLTSSTHTGFMKYLGCDLSAYDILYWCNVEYIHTRYGGLWLDGFYFDINPSRFACRDNEIQKHPSGLKKNVNYDILMMLRKNPLRWSCITIDPEKNICNPLMETSIPSTEELITGIASDHTFGFASSHKSHGKVRFKNPVIKIFSSLSDPQPILLPIYSTTISAGATYSTILDARILQDLLSNGSNSLRLSSDYSFSSSSSAINSNAMITPDGLFTWTPSSNDIGTHIILFKITHETLEDQLEVQLSVS